MPEDEPTNGQSDDSAEFTEVDPAPPETESDADLEAHIDRLAREYTLEEFDAVTMNGVFRRQTLLLLDGGTTVSEWGNALADALNNQFDFPYLDEETEGKLFDGAIDVVGGALRGFLRADVTNMEQLSKDSEFRFQTIMLMEGEATVPEWTDSLAKILNDRIDIPWVPDVAEGMIFRKGLDILGNVLHGLFRGGSKRASNVESISAEYQTA